MTKTLTKEQFDAIRWLINTVEDDGGFLDHIETNAIRMTQTNAFGNYDYGLFVKKTRETLREIVKN
jgi:hypothetical protein